MKTFIKSNIRQMASVVYYATRSYLTLHKGKILVLMYHRVVSENERHQYPTQPGMYVRKDVIEKQLLFLKKYFTIISVPEMIEHIRKKKLEGDKRYCVITFDDGWLDNYQNAYPVLKKHSIPATIFLPTDFIGTKRRFWSDKMEVLLTELEEMPVERMDFFISSLKSRFRVSVDPKGKILNERIDHIIDKCKILPEEEIDIFIEETSRYLDISIPSERVFLNWKEVKEMSSNGISFGSHSCTHRILTKLKIKEIRREIESSLNTLRKKDVNFFPAFCYPNGNYSHAIIRLLKTTEYVTAMTTDFGFVPDKPQDMFSLKRVGIHNDVSSTIPLFNMHISGLARF